jgi:hypothetical protein
VDTSGHARSDCAHYASCRWANSEAIWHSGLAMEGDPRAHFGTADRPLCLAVGVGVILGLLPRSLSVHRKVDDHFHAEYSNM